MDNYETAKLQAQKFFLSLQEETMLSRSPFSFDENHIFVPFLGNYYRICRKTGQVTRTEGSFLPPGEAGFSETLSIFDFLCHESKEKQLSGKWAPADSLKGRPVTLAPMPDFHRTISRRFHDNPAALRRACKALGGKAVPLGDIGYEIPVFPDFSVILKFYFADEEFPAQTILLWDENTLDFLRYETTFYIAGHLLEQLSLPPRVKPYF